MESLFTKQYVNFANYENNLQFTMDHDSGYISHNPESNQDSPQENSNESVSNHVFSKPVYLSEDALLETPELNDKFHNISIEIDKEDYEETRELFNSPDTDTVISSSVVSQEMDYSALEKGSTYSDSSDSDISVEIPRAGQIIVEKMNVLNTLKNSLGHVNINLSESYYFKEHDEILEDSAVVKNVNNFTGRLDENKDTNEFQSPDKPSTSALNNITNILATNDPKKKLTLVLSKGGKENVYSVKRKYRSLTPDKSMTPQNNHSSKNLIPEIQIPPEKILAAENIRPENDKTPEQIEIVTPEKTTVSKGTNDNEELFHGFMPQANSEPKKLCLEQEEISHDVLISQVSDTDVTQEYFNIAPELVRTVTSETTETEMFQNIGCITSKISADEVTRPGNLSISGNNEILQVSTVGTIKTFAPAEKENLPCKALSTTPKKKIENLINPDLSPDLFAEEEQIKETPQIIIQPLDYIADEKYIIKKDIALVKRAQNSLKGVLPPHSVTFVQMTVNEMLMRIKCNTEYFWNNCSSHMGTDDTKSADNSVNTSSESVSDLSKSLLIASSQEDCTRNKWPDILEGRFHGLHHNRSKYSEEFEELCVKYGQRYVGGETQSTCTVFEINSFSPIKRKQVKLRWAAKSPGRRLSHLARRRITFSSANIQAGGSSVSGFRTRQILVDPKKLDLLNRRRSPRKSPRKTPKKIFGKSPRKKARTPNSSAKKKLAMRFRELTGEFKAHVPSTSSGNLIMASKRALFQSPDHDKKSSLFLPSTSGISAFDNELKKPATKRALFMSPSKNSPLKSSPFKKSPFKRLELGLEKKRKRDEDDDAHPSKVQRSVSMDIRPTESEVKTLNRTKSDIGITQNPPKIGELSAIHKKKLQWAVYEALRAHGVTPVHEQFKVFASILARVTRRLLPHITGNAPRPEGSTSERMLRITRRHVYTVLKGKSVDEILIEYLRNKSKNVKPQGYIGLDETNYDGKGISSNKKNVLRDRMNIQESLEQRKLEELCKSKSGSNNKIDRIRKVINFGDDDNR